MTTSIMTPSESAKVAADQFDQVAAELRDSAYFDRIREHQFRSLQTGHTFNIGYTYGETRVTVDKPDGSRLTDYRLFGLSGRMFEELMDLIRSMKLEPAF